MFRAKFLNSLVFLYSVRLFHIRIKTPHQSVIYAHFLYRLISYGGEFMQWKSGRNPKKVFEAYKDQISNESEISEIDSF